MTDSAPARTPAGLTPKPPGDAAAVQNPLNRPGAQHQAERGARQEVSSTVRPKLSLRHHSASGYVLFKDCSSFNRSVSIPDSLRAVAVPISLLPVLTLGQSVMNAEHLSQREPLHEIVCNTLQRYWSQKFWPNLVISMSPLTNSEEWRLHPNLTTYVRPSVDRRARLFIAKRNRHTRSRRRLLATYIRGTWNASLPVLRYRKTMKRFWVAPGIPGSDAIFIVPGNQKVRIFDLSSGIATMVLKAEFSSVSLDSELLVRNSGTPGPYLPILSVDRSGQWIEEPIFEGRSLDVLPPWLPFEEHLADAVAQLAEWLDATSIGRTKEKHYESLLSEAEIASARIDSRYSSKLSSQIMRLLETHLARLPPNFEPRLSVTHGDLQPANIMVPDRGGQPILVDWENAEYRDRSYDLLVLGLGMRSSSGRAQRIEDFIENGTILPVVASYLNLRHRSHRATVARLCLVEDLVFRLRESTGGHYSQVPRGLLELLVDFERLGGESLR